MNENKGENISIHTWKITTEDNKRGMNISVCTETMRPWEWLSSILTVVPSNICSTNCLHAPKM